MHAVANLTGSGHDHQDALLSRHQQQVLRSGQDDKVEGNRIVMRQPAGFWPFRILLLLACFSLSSHALDRQPNADYHARRVALAQKLDGGVAVIFAATEAEGPNATFGFRQDDNFFYLSGLTEPGAALVVAPTFNKNSSQPYTEILFLPGRNLKQEKWTGPKLGPDDPQASAVTGFDRVANLDTLSIELAKLLALGRPALYLDMPERGEQNAASAFLDWSRRANTLGLGTRVNDVKPALAQLRVIKDAGEIERIRHATDASIAAHFAALQMIKPGLNEHDVKARMQYEFMKGGCERPAYAPIVGSGFNSTVLHYSADDAPIRDGDVVVMDVAGEYAMYASDITRTAPANGKFTDRQRADLQHRSRCATSGDERLQVRPVFAYRR